MPRASGSEIHAVNVITGCTQLLAQPSDVVRSAVIDRQGQHLYVHSVARSGRADAGVTRHNLATGETDQVIRPMPRDPSLGRGWETALIWNTTGTGLAVEPCTMMACQTRILDVANGTVRDVDGLHGPTITFTETHLFTFGAGDDWPTQVLKVGFDGSTEVVAVDVLGATLSHGSSGPVEIQTTTGTRSIDP